MTTENLMPVKTPKVKKPKGPIRWGAIVPFTIICLLIGLYMHFFFDSHLRKAIEWGGYKALGVEVNVADLDTSFFKASIEIKGIEVTDSEKPIVNAIKIGSIRFAMLWDALLRARAVINEAAIEQIEFGSPRKHPGKVAPPEPVVVSNEPSAVDKLKDEALGYAKKEYNENVLGDVVSMLGGSDPNAQLKQLESQLPSKAMLEKFQTELQAKQKVWDEKIMALPQGKEIQALGDRIGKVKTSNFKTPQELQQSLQELDAVFKEADAKYKQIQTTSNDLNGDLKNVDVEYKSIEAQIKKDIKELETHFRIPKIDASSLSRGIFMKYLGPYIAKANKYKALAEKYLPPKFTKKGEQEDPADEIAIQPHPREKGITYEFGRPNSYPLFWVKRAGISSQAGMSQYSGNIKGEILDITSNQKLVGRPTIATIEGNFPAMDLSGLLLRLSLDNTKAESVIKYQMNVAAYGLVGKELVQSPDVQIAFKKAYASMKLDGDLVGLKKFTMNLDNQFAKIDYDISAKNQIADEILKAVFAGIPVVTLSAHGEGILPGMALSVNSNIGGELQKGFEKQIQAKIEEAKKKIQAFVDEQIGKQKAQIDAEINKAKDQLNKEVKKVQDQLDAQKKQAEGKVNQAKNDATKQGQQQLEKEGKKVLEDLKGKLGW